VEWTERVADFSQCVGLSVVCGRLRYGERHLTLGVPGRLLSQEHLPLRRTALFDEDGAATSKPDVEVVSVVCRQADLWRLDQLWRRNVNGDATSLGGLLVGARVRCVVR